jgi:hypothetical protein
VQYTAFRIRYEVVVVIDDVLSGFIQAWFCLSWVSIINFEYIWYFYILKSQHENVDVEVAAQVVVE